MHQAPAEGADARGEATKGCLDIKREVGKEGCTQRLCAIHADTRERP